MDPIRALLRTIAARRQSRRSALPLCLWLGAGADISSGGITFNELKRRFVADSYDESFRRLPEEEIDTAFQHLVDGLIPHQLRADLIDYLRRLDSSEVSDSYMLLALLMDNGVVESIITTNFDRMFERAIESVGGRAIHIFGPGVAKPFSATLSERVYLKLHGDVDAGVITHLSRSELTRHAYDPCFTDLAATLIENSHLVILGYSGWDDQLAQIIASAVSRSRQPVYWINKDRLRLDSPLYLALQQRAVPIETTSLPFDEAICSIAQPALEATVSVRDHSVFIEQVIRWRLAFNNARFQRGYDFPDAAERDKVIIARRSADSAFDRFLAGHKPLSVVSGPSGAGKSTFVVRLLDTLAAQDRWFVLLVAAREIPPGGRFEDHLAALLGIASYHGVATLLDLQKWCAQKGRRVLIVIDGLNEHHPDIGVCLTLFRQLMQLCLFMGDDSQLRFLVTVRIETWRSLLSLVDQQTLSAVLGMRDGGTIPLGRFDRDELREAYDLYAERFGVKTPFQRVAPAVLERLADPYLLSLVARHVGVVSASTPTAVIYRTAFESKLRSSTEPSRGPILVDALSRVALLCLDRRTELFRGIDLLDAGLLNAEIRILLDLAIIRETDQYLRFHHDRVLEYFLAIGLLQRGNPPVHSAADVGRLLETEQEFPAAVAALRMLFVFSPDRLGILLELLGDSASGNAANRRVTFAKEVMLEFFEANPAVAAMRAHLLLVNEQTTAEPVLRTILQAASMLPDSEASTVLAAGADLRSLRVRTEATIYCIDRIARRVLTNDITAGQDPFIANAVGLKRALRLLGIVSQAGPDNTTEEERLRIWRDVSRELQMITVSQAERDSLLVSIYENCDRFLFNASRASIARFYASAGRMSLLVILDRIWAQRAALVAQDMETIQTFVRTHDYNFEYQLCNLLFVLSMKNDFEATLHLFAVTLDALLLHGNAEEIDFLLGALLYSGVSSGIDVTEMLEEAATALLRRRPDVVLYSPGAVRGASRGFEDLFDRTFEDGFNPLAGYCFAAPSAQRRARPYLQYVAGATSGAGAMPMLDRELRGARARHDIDTVLRLLHAIGQTIGLWPMEALAAIEPVLGYHEPLVERAIDRILAESYARLPNDTVVFVAASGHDLPPERWYQIKHGIDPRLSFRQFETLEWARIIAFLVDSNGTERFVDILHRFITANDLETGVTHLLGLVAPSLRAQDEGVSQ